MKHHHKSHHIFTFLGVLLLIFIIFFGIRYFQSTYTFENAFVDNSAQDYEEGIDTTNPFLPHPDDVSELDNTRWIRFGSDTLSFLYPNRYALRIANGNYISIIPPLAKNEAPSDCNQYSDEQERTQCLNPDMSPYIIVELVASDNNISFQEESIQDVTIDDQIWQRSSYQDEFGGSVWYRKPIDSGAIQVSYRYHDSLGGVSFDTLHAQYGDQYQLPASEQDKLALAVMKSIELNLN